MVGKAGLVPFSTSRWALVALLVPAAVYFYCLPQTVFYADDGIFLRIVQAVFFEGLSLRKAFFHTLSGSTAVPISQAAALIHLIPFALTRTSHAILYFVLLSHLLSIFLLYDIGRRFFGSRTTGIAAGVIYLLAPGFLNYYSLRVWGIGYLPFSTTVAIWALFQYRTDGRFGSLLILWAALASCLHFHPAAIGLVIAVCWLFCFSPSLPFLTVPYLTGTVFFFLLLIPYSSNFLRSRSQLLALFGLHFLVFLPIAVRRIGKTIVTARLKQLSLTLLAAIAVGTLLQTRTLAFLYLYLDFFAAPNIWLSQKFFLPSTPAAHPFLLSPVLWLLALAMAWLLIQYKELKTNDRLLFSLFWIAASVYWAGQLVLKDWPHHYALPLFPITALWLARSVSLATQNKTLRRPAFALAGVAIVAMAQSDLALQKHLVETGGEGGHCANFGEKGDVLNFLFTQSANPQVVYAHATNRNWNGCVFDGGWNSLWLEHRGKVKIPSPAPHYRYLIAEPRSYGFKVKTLEPFLKAGFRPLRTFRSVVLYIAPNPTH